MRILFAGGADISVPALKICAQQYTVTGVLTHPDAVKGRGRKKATNPVKEEALRLGIPCIETDRFDQPVIEEVKLGKPELLTVVAYGKIFPQPFLTVFPRGGINMHPSLLPKYRGPSPIAAAILNGDTITGITIQQIVAEMDAGDILLQKTIPLTGDETAGDLTSQLAEPGAEMLTETIRRLQNNEITPIPQLEEEASYCHLIRKSDGEINWEESAEIIERKVRAYYPWPRAYTNFNDKSVMILESAAGISPQALSGSPGKVLGIDKKEGILIQTGNGVLTVKRLQLQAKKAMDWRSFVNGNRNFIGSHLGSR